jgi:hypothetical protein
LQKQEKGAVGVGEGATVEVVLVEARDLVAADWGGTSDPYVSVRYGNIKKRTKVKMNWPYSFPIFLIDPCSGFGIISTAWSPVLHI